MKCELERTYCFEAAHQLPHVPDGHKCQRLHGHSYRVTVTLQGPVDDKMGWVVDFGDVDDVVQPIIDDLDHRLLNHIEGLENPTSELLAVWLWRRIAGGLEGLTAVTVAETADSQTTFRGGFS